VADGAYQSRGDADLAEPGRFRAFYADALPRVYGYFLHRCGGQASLAEDLTQETFLAAVAAINRGITVEAPLPWVLGIARHKLLDHFRYQKRAGWSIVPWDDDPDNLELSEEPALPGDETVMHERAVAALARVPLAQREMLVLRYLDGMSITEVVAATGRTESAVESLLSRGRAAFRHAYMEASNG
jgi:RNA polymerase sigma-70 factor (ECF subfamily)